MKLAVSTTVMGFYVALLSDSSSSYFSDNTISAYTTKLPHEIGLEGDWECGVSEVRYRKTFYNVEDREISITKVKTQIIMTLESSIVFCTSGPGLLGKG